MPASLDDYVTEDNPVRVVEAFIDELDLAAIGFEGMQPAATGRPAYHPSTLPKIYLYGYLNRVQSSRRLEREAQRNIELMWLTGRLAPGLQDHRRLPPRHHGPGRPRLLQRRTGAGLRGNRGVALRPKTDTSSAAQRGVFTRHDFVFDAQNDHYVVLPAKDSPDHK